jgi:hypothetical protein
MYLLSYWKENNFFYSPTIEKVVIVIVHVLQLVRYPLIIFLQLIH